MCKGLAAGLKPAKAKLDDSAGNHAWLGGLSTTGQAS
jgi:hypothetical protein